MKNVTGVLFRVVAALLLCALSPGCSGENDVMGEAITPHSKLSNAEVGYSLLYPSDWELAGQVLATEFASSARCESVRIEDFRPPEGSGSGFARQALVQICSKALTDGSALDEFMRLTYGDDFSSRFEATVLGGVTAYRSGRENATVFLQTEDFRLQIATAVSTESEKRPTRVRQVEEILASFSLDR